MAEQALAPTGVAIPPAEGRTGSPPPRTLTKRRLESAITALDQATNHTTQTIATSSLSAQSKRRRVSAPTSLPALEALLPRSSLARAPPAPPPPSYTPLSLATLLTRLASFKLATFSPLKPAPIGPLSCAFHGWQSSPTPHKPKDRVQCVTCGAGLVLALPGGGWGSPLGQRLAGEMERQVVATGHNASCPWRTRPCARGLYALPAGMGRNALVDELRGEMGKFGKKGVEGMVLKLPVGVGEEEREKVSEAVREANQVASAAGAKAPAAEVSPPTDQSTAALLALFGWQAPSTHILTCKYCTRQVPLSAYLPKPSAPSSDPAPPPPAFDLVAQHQAFCPYVSSPASTAMVIKPDLPSGLSTIVPRVGWQIRLDTILRRERRGTWGGQGAAAMLGTTVGGTPNGKQGVSGLTGAISRQVG